MNTVTFKVTRKQWVNAFSRLKVSGKDESGRYHVAYLRHVDARLVDWGDTVTVRLVDDSFFDRLVTVEG